MSVSDEVFLCQQCFLLKIIKKYPHLLILEYLKAFPLFSNGFIWLFSFFFKQWVTTKKISPYLFLPHFSTVSSLFVAGAIVVFMAQWPLSLPHLTPRYSLWDKPEYIMSLSQKYSTLVSQ